MGSGSDRHEINRLWSQIEELRHEIRDAKAERAPAGGGWAWHCGWRVGDIKPTGYPATTDHSQDGFTWLYCDGRSLLRASYASLFAAIGTTFGSADGTHFTLPDLRNRYPLGAGTGHALASDEGLDGDVNEPTRAPSSHTHDPAALEGTLDKDDLTHNHGGSVSVTGHTDNSSDASAAETGTSDEMDAFEGGLTPANSSVHTHPIAADAFQHHTHPWTCDSAAISNWTPAADLVVTIAEKGGYDFSKSNWPPHQALYYFILSSRP